MLGFSCLIVIRTRGCCLSYVVVFSVVEAIYVADVCAGLRNEALCSNLSRSGLFRFVPYGFDSFSLILFSFVRCAPIYDPFRSVSFCPRQFCSSFSRYALSRVPFQSDPIRRTTTLFYFISIVDHVEYI